MRPHHRIAVAALIVVTGTTIGAVVAPPAVAATQQTGTFTGSKSTITGFDELRGDWAFTGTGTVTSATRSYRSLLASRADASGAFSVAATVQTQKPTLDVWNGVVADLRRDPTGKGWRFVTLRVRQGPSAAVWQFVAVDTVANTDQVLDSGLLAGSTTAPLRIVLRADGWGGVSGRVERGGKAVVDRALVGAVGMTWPKGARVGVYSHAGWAAFSGFSLQQRAAAPKPPAITLGASGWNTTWRTSAPTTVEASPYTVEQPVVQERSLVDGVLDDSRGTPQQGLYTASVDGVPTKQYVGSYTAERRVAISARTFDATSSTWGPWSSPVVLPTVLPQPDGHYRIAIAQAPDGQVHVAANMWGSPLVFFSTTTPGDVSTLRRVPSLGSPASEAKTTYPAFLTATVGGQHRLLFLYRSGGSGNGSWVVAQDLGGGRWSPLSSTDLFANTSASGSRYSAYPSTTTPQLGPDGRFHLAWVWRSTADASSNSRISTASSPDLVHWYAASGVRIAGPGDPISYDDTAAVVDDVREGGGTLNGLVSLGFDGTGATARPVVAFERYDAAGSNQVFASRWDGTAWWTRQLTSYVGRWEPSGIGSIPTPFTIAPVAAHPEAGVLTLPYVYGTRGGTLVLDPTTLAVRAEQPWRTYSTLIPARPGMSVVTTFDQSGYVAPDGGQYLLLHHTAAAEAALPADADRALTVVRAK